MARKYINHTFYFLVTSSIVTFLAKTAIMVLQFEHLLLARLTIMTLVYVAVLSLELFVLDRLLKVSTLRVELLQRGNVTVRYLEEEITQIPIHVFHKRRVRSLTLPARAAQAAVTECPARPVARDEIDDLERQYLGSGGP